MAFTLSQSRTVDAVAPSVPSSRHGQCCNSHNIHLREQQPCSLPRQSPAVAGWAQLTRKAKAGGSRSGRELEAQSAVLFFGFPVRCDISEKVGPTSYFPSCLSGSRGLGSSALPAPPWLHPWLLQEQLGLGPFPSQWMVGLQLAGASQAIQ